MNAFFLLVACGLLGDPPAAPDVPPAPEAPVPATAPIAEVAPRLAPEGFRAAVQGMIGDEADRHATAVPAVVAAAPPDRRDGVRAALLAYVDGARAIVADLEGERVDDATALDRLAALRDVRDTALTTAAGDASRQVQRALQEQTAFDLGAVWGAEGAVE